VPKTDYYNDPDAPKANSLVVAVGVIVQNASGHVLMIQRSDNGLWALPGGAQDLGESTRDAAVRETFEETGVRVEVTGVTGIYSDPSHVIEYDDGEVRQEFIIMLRAVPATSTQLLRTSAESRNVEWVSPDAFESKGIGPSTLTRLRHGLGSKDAVYLS
jgi:8-oxo-dGTP pyrophosphatase MutT (NUDIX family)